MGYKVEDGVQVLKGGEQFTDQRVQLILAILPRSFPCSTRTSDYWTRLNDYINFANPHTRFSVDKLTGILHKPKQKLKNRKFNMQKWHIHGP
ncbi:hypothetical protein CEXT_193821 [Caerostris extrusa]|uniref:Uncharacterized protein n=1 Tax=Caerostris extrusa TaxID=172846 RepID=A0AAV4UIP2_CAEEX|nr:hypothetical protein CEXT_193821 [Caerostris extrusa]